MVRIFRGTYFKHFAKNFNGKIIENRTGSQWNEIYLTPELEKGIKYALNYLDEEHSYVPLVLEFEIPEDYIYILHGWDEDKNQPTVINEKSRILEKAENGEQTVIRKDKADKKWTAPFIKTKYLKAIIEVPRHAQSMKDVEEKGRKIEIDGKAKRLQKYFQKRTSE